jgi:beta-phosphoglucomutase
MEVKLVIFDLDGVLVDACEWHRESLNRALREVCDYEISSSDHYEIFNGLPTRIKLEKLTEMGVLSTNIHGEIYKRKQDLTVRTIDENAFERKEKISLMRHLRERNCFIACYTNSIRKTATLMLDKTGVLEHLDYLITNQEVKNPKPHPEGYNFLVKKFNLKKENVLIVEDSPKGKQAAYASGCKVVEVDNADDVNIELFKEYFK